MSVDDVLIALGGGVLITFMALIHEVIGVDVEPFLEAWLLPCGAVAGVVVAFPPLFGYV